MNNRVRRYSEGEVGNDEAGCLPLPVVITVPRHDTDFLAESSDRLNFYRFLTRGRIQHQVKPS